MAPFKIASLPLMSCFGMLGFSSGEGQFGSRGARRSRPLIDFDAAGFGACQEAETTTRASAAGVNGEVVSVTIETLRQVQDAGRAGCHAQSTAFALFRVHDYRAFVRSWFDHAASSFGTLHSRQHAARFEITGLLGEAE